MIASAATALVLRGVIMPIELARAEVATLRSVAVAIKYQFSSIPYFKLDKLRPRSTARGEDGVPLRRNIVFTMLTTQADAQVEPRGGGHDEVQQQTPQEVALEVSPGIVVAAAVAPSGRHGA